MSAAETGVNPKLPTWDGDWRTFSDFRLACYLELDGLKDDDKITLAPRLARNLTGKAWEACLDVDRTKLRKADGLEYLLTFLKGKRGKQQVDILGEAFEKFFQSGDAIRRDRENLTDYEQRLSVFYRDIKRGLQEMGAETEVPQEIYGWYLLNQQVRLEPSDLATLKSQASTYKLDDVMAALRKMWGGDSLSLKDQERKKSGKAYVATNPEDGEDDETAWWNDANEEPDHDEMAEQESNEIWFEQALEALQEDPMNELVLANFNEAKRAFYKDARKALDANRVNRGFYPNQKGKAKGKGKGPDRGKNDGPPPFRGKCMRCGRHGHKAQHCPTSSGKDQGSGKGSGVGFVFSTWPRETPPQTVLIAETNEIIPKAILDCGASESIVGAHTLQDIGDSLNDLGFKADDEIRLNTNQRKTFIYGNNASSQSLGAARLTTGIHGREHELDVHVVEGGTPMLLSGKWLWEQKAVVDFGLGQAYMPTFGGRILQLERSATNHLMLPITAFEGNEAVRELTQVSTENESPLLRAIAQAATASEQAAMEE